MADGKSLFIVEDHPIMRNGLRSIISEIDEFKIVGEAGTLGEARQKIYHLHPEFVLLDISLPDGSGLELLKEMLTAGEPIKFVVLTMHQETPYIMRAKELGASGFVIKDMAPEALAETMLRVLDGERVFPDISPEESVGKRKQELSPREQKVKEMLVQGMSLTDIGKQLGLSVKTISTYRTRILAKLGVANNAELVKLEMKSNVGV